MGEAKSELGRITAEIIIVGNEVLLGDVVDTNSNWLCRQLSGLGVVVQRITTVRDERDVVAEVLQQAIARQGPLVLLAGGLGPTSDDLTLAAVAQALGRTLVVHPLALQWVGDRFHELASEGSVASADLTPPRIKMATMPAGAQPLPNRVGTAPGVMLAAGETLVFCLPGVPAELQQITDTSVLPAIAERWPTGYYAEWRLRVTTGDESLLAPALQALGGQHPQVYLKSRAGHFGPDVQFLVTLSARDGCRDRVSLLLEEALRDLRSELEHLGLRIASVER